MHESEKWKWSRSVVSHSVQHHRWQPTRLPCPWDSPGKNTGVGCHFLLQCMKVKSESEVTCMSEFLHLGIIFGGRGKGIKNLEISKTSLLRVPPEQQQPKKPLWDKAYWLVQVTLDFNFKIWNCIKFSHLITPHFGLHIYFGGGERGSLLYNLLIAWVIFKLMKEKNILLLLNFLYQTKVFRSNIMVIILTFP